jgi:DNA-directed RNA polymerase specialized sigma24 family protein
MNPPLDKIAGDAHWPSRLAEACGHLRTARDSEECRAARENLWALLYFGLRRCSRAVASRRGMSGSPDIDDLAAGKSLEILRRVESGAMDLSGKAAVDVVAFLSAVARHGLLDVKRKEARWPTVDLSVTEVPSSVDPHGWPLLAAPPAPYSMVEGKEFAIALRSCVENMPLRSMRIWFFRVFLEMSSREIAVHPEVNLNPPHVDVILQRARAALKACMEEKGHAATHLPPGTFAEVWECIRGEERRPTACEGTAMDSRGSRALDSTPSRSEKGSSDEI